MNDWELLQNYLQRGSEAAFRTLVERYYDTPCQKWEYKQSPTQVGDDTLNKWADEGWSVVCVGTDSNGHHFYVLKRPKK